MFYQSTLSFHPPVQNPCFHAFDVHVGIFDAEIVPRKKTVERKEVIALGDEPFEPNMLNHLFAIEFKKYLYFVQIQVNKRFFYDGFNIKSVKFC